MGDEVHRDVLVVGRPEEVRRRLEDCVTALAAMVEGGWFTGHEDTVGMEVELDLIDPLGRPRPVNDAVLARLGRPDLQHELGRFNIELNMPPERLAGGGLAAFERRLTALLGTGEVEALGVRLAAIGTLPTLGAEHLTRDRLSSPSRYALLASRMRAERRRPVAVHIAGPGARLARTVMGVPGPAPEEQLAPESASTPRRVGAVARRPGWSSRCRGRRG